jgi:predicted ribosome quality control (RQC) complex YloA/Tae2 family protein
MDRHAPSFGSRFSPASPAAVNPYNAPMDIFTLDRIVLEISGVVAGLRVRDVTAAGPGIVGIETGRAGAPASGDGASAGLAGATRAILLTARKEGVGIALATEDGGTRAPDRCAPDPGTQRFAERLREAARGARIGAPCLVGGDRVVSLPIRERGTLIIELPSSAIVWLSGDPPRIECRLIPGHGPERLSRKAAYEPPAAPHSPLDIPPEAVARAAGHPWPALARATGGALVAREILHRAGERAGDTPEHARPDGARIAAAFAELRAEASGLRGGAHVYRIAGGRYIATAWLAGHLGPAPESFASASEAAARALHLARTESSLESERRAALAAVRAREKKLASRLAAAAADLESAGRHPEMRRWAEALLAYIARVPRRASEARIPDPADPGSALTIPLDPAATPQANAERYFQNARRFERALPKLRARVAVIEEERAALAAARSQIEAAGDGEAVRAAAGRAGVAPRGGGAGPPSPPRAGREGAPGRGEAGGAGFHPRRYVTSEGWTVLVGRNNEENDRLTHKVARPDDIWLHVHGASGSHVILRREGRKQNPSRQTLLEAAAIAAYHSKARASSRAPVIYTLRKHVRKPRGGAPGLAVCTHEKMVMVKPGVGGSS